MDVHVPSVRLLPSYSSVTLSMVALKPETVVLSGAAPTNTRSSTSDSDTSATKSRMDSFVGSRIVPNPRNSPSSDAGQPEMGAVVGGVAVEGC